MYQIQQEFRPELNPGSDIRCELKRYCLVRVIVQYTRMLYLPTKRRTLRLVGVLCNWPVHATHRLDTDIVLYWLYQGWGFRTGVRVTLYSYARVPISKRLLEISFPPRNPLCSPWWYSNLGYLIGRKV